MCLMRTTWAPSMFEALDSLLATTPKPEQAAPAPPDEPPRRRDPIEKAAGPDWLYLQAHPDELETFRRAVAVAAIREAGERPPHYTRVVLCEHCGPVWLWESAPPRVLGCPWCLNEERYFPRPPVRCGICRYFTANPNSPTAGVGNCASVKPPRHVPRPGTELICPHWRPLEIQPTHGENHDD